MLRLSALALAVLFAMPAAAQDAPLVRFGAIADPQYAPAPPRGTRYYGNSLWKLAEAVEALNAEELDFVVTLGDIIDRHVESYNHILPIYQRLEAELDAAQAAGETVIVFDRVPAAPEDQHNLWNYQEVQALLAGYPNVMAYLNGHNHAGHYGEVDGIHYVTVEGMLETATTTAYAIVEVYGDRIEIDGFGRATDRVLPFKGTN